MRNLRKILKFLPAILLGTTSLAWGDEPTAASNAVAIDTMWTLIAAFLVFFMQAGFAMVEAGFTRAKNACNIMMKNLMDFAVGSIAYWAVGFAIMFGTSAFGLFGKSGFFLSGVDPSTADGMWQFTFWIFQAVFAATAATIVSGAMAGRTKFTSYLAYSAFLTAIIYPIVGHWIWGGGWLANLNFADFAGSTVVHSVGGFAALIGTIMLKPREGKFNPDGSANAISGHNIPLASLGVFILWFGWFGFNPGSTLSVGNGDLIARVAINTNLAAAAGGILAMATVWKMFGKPDLSMAMNGALAGLVAITAGCAFVDPWAAIAIGAVGGVLVVLGVVALDKIGIDDPVGAFPVHGINGVWGTLAIGLFGKEALGVASNGLFYGGGLKQLGVQALGAGATVLFILVAMGIVFKLIDKTIGLRVTREEELKGLDIGEHGMESYAGFQIFTTE